MLGNVSCLFLSLAVLLENLSFQKTNFSNTISVSNSLDPDQDRLSVGPELDPNCLQSLSAGDFLSARKELNR